MKELKCRLLEYSVLYSGKIMWGLDCDLEDIKKELYKIQGYLFVLQSLETTNLCEAKIPTGLVEKINTFIRSLNRKVNKKCNNC